MLEVGLVLEDATSGFCGAVLRWERGLVVLEDRHGKQRTFALARGSGTREARWWYSEAGSESSLCVHADPGWLALAVGNGRLTAPADHGHTKLAW